MHLHAFVQLSDLAAHGLSLPGFSPKGLQKLLRPKGLVDVWPLALIAIAPVAVWFIKRRVDRWEERQQRNEARRCAVDVAVTLSRSIQVCENVRQSLQAAERVPDATVAAAIEALDHSRRTLRLYLQRHIPLHELIPLAAAAERRLGEGHQAMLTLHDPPGDAERNPVYAHQLQTVRAELQSVVDRLRGLQPDLGRAIAKVDAGWALSD